MEIVVDVFDLFEPTWAVEEDHRSCVFGSSKSEGGRECDLKVTVFGQNHKRSQATRATTNVSCAVCRTNVVTDNSKRMTVTVVEERDKMKNTPGGEGDI